MSSASVLTNSNQIEYSGTLCEKDLVLEGLGLHFNAPSSAISTQPSEKTSLQLIEAVNDDDFNDCFDEESTSRRLPSSEVENDINAINRRWNAKRENLEKSEDTVNQPLDQIEISKSDCSQTIKRPQLPLNANSVKLPQILAENQISCASVGLSGIHSIGDISKSKDYQTSHHENDRDYLLQISETIAKENEPEDEPHPNQIDVPKTVSLHPDITFDDALDKIKSNGIIQGDIHPTSQRKGIRALRHLLLGPPKLNSNLIMDRNDVFNLAQTPFQNDNEVHLRMLQTLYRFFTSSEGDCPRYGEHWQDVGFQGNDPSTDFRGCGLFSLLQITFICTDSAIKSQCLSLYELSRTANIDFPICVLFINFTKTILKFLREDRLNKLCNFYKDVFLQCNKVYSQLIVYFHSIWLEKKYSIIDIGDVMDRAEKQSRLLLSSPSKFKSVVIPLSKQSDDRNQSTEQRYIVRNEE